MTKQLNPGDKAPDFKLSDQHGAQLSLSDFKGQKLLIYFYPKAMTPGCTAQSCSVRDSRAGFASQGVKVLGVSADQPEKQLKFDEKYQLDFPLLADTEHEMAEAYGVWAPKKLYGREFMGIVRSAFLIDGNGVVIQCWYKVKPADTVPNAEAALNKK